MAEEKSVAEELGMLFEERCARALEGLEQLWEVLQDLSTEDVRFSEERKRNKEARIAKIDEPKKREDLATLLQGLDDRDRKKNEEAYQKAWEEELQNSRRMYGTDAVEFALKVIQDGRKAH